MTQESLEGMDIPDIDEWQRRGETQKERCPGISRAPRKPTAADAHLMLYATEITK